MNLATQIASNKSGRIVLHAICLLRRPARAAWHWRGIVREISDGSFRALSSRAISISVALFVFFAWRELAAF